MFSLDQKQAMGLLIETALGEIATLAERFALLRQSHSALASAIGKLIVLWADLHEIRPTGLRGCGEVAPELENAIDPSVQRLVAVIDQILNTLQE